MNKNMRVLNPWEQEVLRDTHKTLYQYNILYSLEILEGYSRKEILHILEVNNIGSWDYRRLRKVLGKRIQLTRKERRNLAKLKQLCADNPEFIKVLAREILQIHYMRHAWKDLDKHNA